MNSKQKTAILVLFLGGFLCFFSCKEKQYRHDETVHVSSEDTTIMVKISHPEKWTKKDKIIIWSKPSLEDEFLPDSVENKRYIRMSSVLRRSLLDTGYLTIEYIGRNDSINFLGRRYRSSDSNTKARDLENLLDHIRSDKRLRHKKIILIGYSEGGDINMKTASKRPSDISAMVQLATVALSGKQITEYQINKVGYFNLLVLISSQERMDAIFNKMSSLDSYHTLDLDGVKQFVRENMEPVDNYIYQYESPDSIYYHIDLYLRDRWQREGAESKDFFQNDFELYYKEFAGNITPQQIALRAVKPENYYPLIRCPVLAVHGTEDERIDCYPNVEAMERLLKEGGNHAFQKIILENCRHNLAKWDGGGYYVEEDMIRKIISWINER